MKLDAIRYDFQKYVAGFCGSGFVNKDVGRITTPFLDSHNDLIEVYIEQLDIDSYRLFDDGITIADLRLSGVDVKEDSGVMQVIRRIALRNNVTLEGDSLSVQSNRENLPVNIFFLSRAMQSISDATLW